MNISVNANQLLSLSFRALLGVLASFIALCSTYSKLTSIEQLLKGEVIIVTLVWVVVLSGSVAYLSEGDAYLTNWSYLSACAYVFISFTLTAAFAALIIGGCNGAAPVAMYMMGALALLGYHDQLCAMMEKGDEEKSCNIDDNNNNNNNNNCTYYNNNIKRDWAMATMSVIDKNIFNDMIACSEKKVQKY